jgi:hypothetical protein
MRLISRRWRFVVPALLLGALAVAGFAYSASGPNAQLASQNRVYGGANFTTFDGSQRNFAVDGHASGQAAFGDVEYASSSHYSHEQVLCLNVGGNKAVVGAVITQADRPETVGLLVLWVVADNGTPISGTPDQATLQVSGPAGDPGWPAGFPMTCPSPDAATAFFGLQYFPLNGGDVVVQSAQ